MAVFSLIKEVGGKKRTVSQGIPENFLIKNKTNHPMEMVVLALSGDYTYFRTNDIMVEFILIEGTTYDTIVAKIEK